MLSIPANVCVYLCTKPTDMRKGFDGLHSMVLQVFARDPLDGHLFLFVNRRRDRIKALWWEPGGLILWYKRLEQGTFEMPRADAGRAHVTIDATQLAMLIGGVSLTSARKRRKRMDAA